MCLIQRLFLYIFWENPLKVTLFETRATLGYTKREIVERNFSVFLSAHEYDVTYGTFPGKFLDNQRNVV